MPQKLIETEVTYVLHHDGKIFVVEHVPARVCGETGEQFFAPETVEHIQRLIQGTEPPKRFVEAPVYDYG